mmetsp:Transcript_13461/g.42597  ORF Transcript_13461/g.42597 Transcript_13461/m.42597 type:complete len:111 (+) Transcript_13461:106-438(+)
MSSAWTKLAGVSGALAVGVGAYGAHGFKPKDPKYEKVFDTASRYHMLHSLALLAAPSARYPALTGGLLSAGMLTFCGSCYVVAFKEDRAFAKVAPIGGMALIAGWLSFVL